MSAMTKDIYLWVDHQYINHGHDGRLLKFSQDFQTQGEMADFAFFVGSILTEIQLWLEYSFKSQQGIDLDVAIPEQIKHLVRIMRSLSLNMHSEVLPQREVTIEMSSFDQNFKTADCIVALGSNLYAIDLFTMREMLCGAPEHQAQLPRLLATDEIRRLVDEYVKFASIYRNASF